MLRCKEVLQVEKHNERRFGQRKAAHARSQTDATGGIRATNWQAYHFLVMRKQHIMEGAALGAESSKVLQIFIA